MRQSRETDATVHMKILSLSAIAVALLVAGCSQPRETSPHPLYGAWGYDAAGSDKTTRAGDDFFRFANGAWLDRAQIPADKPAISLGLLMTDRTESRLHDLMEQAAAK